MRIVRAGLSRRALATGDFIAKPVFLLGEVGRKGITEVSSFHDWADLDLARARHRIGAALHPLDRLGHVPDLPQSEARDQLAGLGEGPIDDRASGPIEGDPFALSR